jgi:CDGSH-type Zn-finger protein
MDNKIKVEILENGPLLVHGDLQVNDKNGSLDSQKKVTAFCRCGASDNKPFCDGNHRKIEFRG